MAFPVEKVFVHIGLSEVNLFPAHQTDSSLPAEMASQLTKLVRFSSSFCVENAMDMSIAGSGRIRAGRKTAF